MRFLIKFATRGRLSWFCKAIDNIQTTFDGNEYRILVTADIDDPSMREEGIPTWIRDSHKITIVHGHSESKIHAINKDMEISGDWDVLVCMSDDMFFEVHGWNRIIESKIKEFFPEGDCFLHFDDGYVHDALATMTIVDRKYYQRDNYIYHPSYKSFSCDAEAFYVAIMRGRHKYFPEILARHQHPTNKPIPNDETYRRNSLHTDHDTKNYFERLRRHFDEPTGSEILKSRTELKRYL